MNPEDIEHRFCHHSPTGGKIVKHTEARVIAMNAAHELNDLLPEGREKALAITKLEEALMWANAAIARNQC